MYDEERHELYKKKQSIIRELRSLYAILNTTQVVPYSEDDIKRDEEAVALQNEIDMLERRIATITELGYQKCCPCCGLELPENYMKCTKEDLRKKKERLQEIVEAERGIEYANGDNEIAQQISIKEAEFREIDKILEELRKMQYSRNER